MYIELYGWYCIYIYEVNKNKIHVITDITASYPVFYTVKNDRFVCSLNFSDIWIRERVIVTNKNAFYEFLVLRRLIGTKHMTMIHTF